MENPDAHARDSGDSVMASKESAMYLLFATHMNLLP
jgi:hypothetical protein